MYSDRADRALHSFPTRRSSDLEQSADDGREDLGAGQDRQSGERTPQGQRAGVTHEDLDRKSTRLNSSHVAISYAVFCSKKKYEGVDMYAPAGGWCGEGAIAWSR